MFGNIFNGTDVISVKDRIFKELHLALKSCGKNSKAHYFDKTDVFLFDVVIFGMRMVNAHGMFICSYVVAQYEIEFESAFAVFACDGSDCIVGNTVSFREDECIFVSVFFPLAKDQVSAVRRVPSGKYNGRPGNDRGSKWIRLRSEYLRLSLQCSGGTARQSSKAF